MKMQEMLDLKPAHKPAQDEDKVHFFGVTSEGLSSYRFSRH